MKLTVLACAALLGLTACGGSSGSGGLNYNGGSNNNGSNNNGANSGGANNGNANNNGGSNIGGGSNLNNGGGSNMVHKQLKLAEYSMEKFLHQLVAVLSNGLVHLARKNNNLA